MLFSASQRENLNAGVRNLRTRGSFHLQIVHSWNSQCGFFLYIVQCLCAKGCLKCKEETLSVQTFKFMPVSKPELLLPSVLMPAVCNQIANVGGEAIGQM